MTALPVWLDLDQLAGHDPDPAWRDRARCFGLPFAVFFPDTPAETDHTIATHCDPCPVRLDCLADHLNEAHGVFGGTSRKQRVIIRRRLRIAP